MKWMEDLYRYLEEKKAGELLWLDLSEVNPYFQYFLIGSATSSVHLRSLVRDIKKNFREHLSGRSEVRMDEVESGWVVVDFIDLVVHLFLPEQRIYYRLERLWGDAKILRSGTSPEKEPSEQKKGETVWTEEERSWT